MSRRSNVEAYLNACDEGEEILEYCKMNNIQSYYRLMNSKDGFPKDKREKWFKRLCSPGFIRFLSANGIK